MFGRRVHDAMMVSLRHRLVVLAMPKCASSTLESALAPHMDVVIRGVPSAKHTPFRKYNRHLRKYFEDFTDGTLETVCLFREPKAWLHSWWRYRARDKMPNKSRSTRDLNFDDFVKCYLESGVPPADVGRQSRFISDANGIPSVDRLFQYENLPAFITFIKARTGLEPVLDWQNVSPAAHLDDTLSLDTQRRLRRELALDFDIYDRVTSDTYDAQSFS